MRRNLTDRGRGVLIGGIVLTAAGMLLGFVDLVRVGLTCAALPVICLLLAWWRRPRLEVRRAVTPTPLEAGQIAAVRVDVRNVGTRRSDVMAAAEQASPGLPGGARLVLPSLAPQEHTTMSYRVRPARRGLHGLGPLVATRRDPLGLTTGTATFGGSSPALVLPRVHDLSGAAAPRIVGHQGDDPASVVGGGERDVSLRAYRLGDDLRQVHWAVTAHRGELMVRHEAQPAIRRAVLVLDAAASAWGASPQRPFDWAVEALASIAANLARQGFALHLVVGGAEAATTAGGRRDDLSGTDTTGVLRRLALAEPDAVAVPKRGAVASALYGSARELAGSGGLIVVATGDGDPAGAHDAFGVVRSGSTGLALVADTAAFAAPVSSATLGDGPAERLCAFARAGGWHAGVARPDIGPGEAWAALVGGVGVGDA
ncbi:MAG: DUF58 domain-containing protein [Dermatophilaceae bacterium]